MISLNELKDLLYRICFDFRKEKFTLKSGARSNYYLDLRKAGTRGESLVKLSRFLAEKLPPEGFDCIASVELGAVFPATGLIYAYYELYGKDISNLVVRKEPKGHGVGGYFVGEIPEPGTKMVLIEDVITSGSSANSALEKLLEAGYDVTKVFMITDRSCDGGQEIIQLKALLKEMGIQMECLFVFQDFVDQYNDW